jgi:tetratricopeptide (TPR) repeat protein
MSDSPGTGSQVGGFPRRALQASTRPADLSSVGPTAGAPIDPAVRAREEAARGDVLYSRAQFRQALGHFREAVRLQPANSDYRFRLASTAWRAGEAREVAPNYREAIRLDPRFSAAHEAMGQWSLQRGDVRAALGYSAAALALSPRDPITIISRIHVLAGDGQTQAAWQLLEPIIASGMTGAQVAMAYALVAPTVGREEQAVAMLEGALGRSELGPTIRPDLHFAAAGLLDRLGRYDQAFDHAQRANTLSGRSFSNASHSAAVADTIGYFTDQRLRSLPRATQGNRRPVLIVGMPRSGTSLVEQILASHPDVFGAGELPTLAAVAQRVGEMGKSRGLPMPRSLDLLGPDQADVFAGQYLEAITSVNATSRHVTDKMPSNFLHLGLAAALLPHCRVIHCVRDPRDTCLSCYFTHFADGNGFSFDLGDLAAYYRDYSKLMAHWKQVLPLPMLEVRYEDVVEDMEGQTRRMLAFLDLPWDARCLNFHETKRHVATASREQVRRPLYASSVGRWKHYEKHIAELLALMPRD